MGKRKEKEVGTVFLRWGELPSWRLVEKKIEITHNFSVTVKMEFGPMQVMASVPETTRIPELRFSFERTHYWPGEVVQGVLTCSIAQPRPIYGLQLSFDGFNYVDWYDEYANTIFHGTDIYFSARDFLIGHKPPASKKTREIAEKNGERELGMFGGYYDQKSVKEGSSASTSELPAGVRHYPFSFQLPLNIPHSMTHMDGCVGVFYFIEAKIFEIGGRKPTFARYAIQVVPPVVKPAEDPTISRNEVNIIQISKHGPSLSDNYSQSINDDSLDLSTLSDAWSPSSSLSTFDHIYEPENTTHHLSKQSDSIVDNDIDLEVDDDKWLQKKTDHTRPDSKSFKLRQRAFSAAALPGSPINDSPHGLSPRGDGNESPRRYDVSPGKESANGSPPRGSFKRSKRDSTLSGGSDSFVGSPGGGSDYLSPSSPRRTGLLDSSEEDEGGGFKQNSSFFFGEDDSGEELAPGLRELDKDVIVAGGATPGSSKSQGLTSTRIRSVSASSGGSKSRVQPISIHATLPPLAITGKRYVFLATIENRSGKPITSIRVQVRSQLVLTGHAGGKPHHPLREWRSQRATIVKAAINNLPQFPIQNNTAWRGDIAIDIPEMLYPSVQVRHLALVYQIKIEARTAGKKIPKFATPGFSLPTATPFTQARGMWMHPITVVQASPDKEVEKIKPPTELKREPCKWNIGSHSREVDSNVVPLPIAADGAIPIIGYQLSSKAFA